MSHLPANIFYPKDDGPFKITLEASTLMVASAKGKKGSCGVVITAEQVIDIDYIQNFGRKFAEYLQARESDLEWKIIGSNMNLFAILGAIRAQQGFVVKEIARKEKIASWFWPADSKLRISKSASAKTRVMIVDDSKTIRDILAKICKEDSRLEVVGLAEHPGQVEEMIKNTQPDVMTLDVHMPDIDGVTLLKRIFPLYQIPTIMITSLSPDDGPYILNALEAGAIDYIKKPEFKEIREMAPIIREKIKMAAEARMQMKQENKNILASDLEMDQEKLIAIGSSTGGTEALKEILVKLPEKIPPILIVQHIPPVFSAAFAQRLNGFCPFEVREARDGDLVEAGVVLIAPGGKQMLVEKKDGHLKIRITDDPPCNRHKPSVDVLFNSLANHSAAITVGIILTGMGSDGAKGLLELLQNGAQTIVQDEKSSVVFGMPKEAIKLGAAQHVEDLMQIACKIVSLSAKRRTAA